MGTLHHSDKKMNLTNGIPPKDHLRDSIMNLHNSNMNVQLHKAAKEGNLSIFKSVFHDDFKHNTIQPSKILTPNLQNSLIHTAASFNNANILKYLLHKCPDLLNQANYKKDTAHHIAAREGHLEVVKTIISFADEDLEIYGRSNSLMNEDGNTPLHEAMIHEREKVVDYYLEISHTLKKEYCLGFYASNKEGKSPLYLAVEAGNVKNVKIMLEYGLSRLNQYDFLDQITSGKSLIHAAIAGKNLVLLQRLASINRELVYIKDEKQQNTLHYASSVGFLGGLKYLLFNFDMDVFEKDKDGFCPIHLASKNGHVEIIKHFLQLYPDAREFIDNKRKNILHVAAENGKDVVIINILKSPASELLLNERDVEGNTCLHLATGKWHSKVVSSLTWDKRVNPKLTNNSGLTALEVAEQSMEVMAPFRQRLTWMALMSAGAARAQVRDVAAKNRLKAAYYEPYSMDYCKDRVNTLLLVSALVATITFQAGFTMPGFSNTGSNVNHGVEIMLYNRNIIIFLLSDFLAFCSSITVVVILMWAQLGDLNLMLNALRVAQMCLGFSLTMTTLAFMVGIQFLLGKLAWLATVVLTMGILSVASLLALFVPLFLPYTSNFRIARYISYYPFYVLIMVSESFA